MHLEYGKQLVGLVDVDECVTAQRMCLFVLLLRECLSVHRRNSFPMLYSTYQYFVIID